MHLREATARIQGGGVLLYPAETVYGLGGDARRPDVAARIHTLKGSDPRKPILALTDTWDRVAPWVADAAALRRLWRRDDLGPVTLVLRATAAAPRSLRSADERIGLRRTTSSSAAALIAACDAPLFSTSANRTGEPPPVRLDEVSPDIRRAVDGVLEADAPLGGQPSTVARFDGRAFAILRPGPVSLGELAAAL